MHRFLPLITALAVAGSLSAQTTVLSEDFSSGVPPTGWTHVNNNGSLTVGWIADANGRAWHEDESSSLGTSDNTLISPVMDLTGLAAVYLHFEGETNWATYLANHPNSVGDGVSTMEITTDGGLTWTVVWTDTSLNSGDEYTPDVDLSAWGGMNNVQLGIHFYGTFAQEWWVDNILIDDSPVGPPPSGDAWTVNLPTTFASVPFADDFDTSAGTIPSYMALTNVDEFGVVDAEAWCNVGQLAPCLVPNSGAFNLEMGLIPGSTNYHNVRNAMVIGIAGGGTTGLSLDFMGYDGGEEANDADGVWVSSDGANWYAVSSDWDTTLGGLTSTWTSVADMDLTGTPVDTTGDFYLMFQQFDNFPYDDLDGIGIDDIVVDGGTGGGPTLAVTGTCPGVMTLSGSGLTPSGPVAIVAGPAGSFTVPSGSCAGLMLDIAAPSLLAVVPADGAGDVNASPSVPGGACGATVQMIDLTACLATNGVTL